MSTENKIITGGGIMPSTTDTPGDVRTRVETFADIANIDNPFVGMEVWVVDEAKEYRIKKLIPKIIGGVEIPNGAVDIEDPTAVVDAKQEIIDETMEKVDDTIVSVKQEIIDETMKQVVQNTVYDEETGRLVLL